MKRKIGFPELFIAAFAVLLFSTNSVFAQCGNYFNPNYQVISKLNPTIFPLGFREPRLNDWTGDGRADFWNFRWNAATNGFDVVIYPAKPTGYWDWETEIAYRTTIPASVVDSFRILDINADGRMDMVYGNGNSFRLYRNDGNGSLIATPLPDSNGFPDFDNLIGFTDLNGDNRLDWIYYFSGRLKYQLQNADGTFGTETVIFNPPSEHSFVSNAFGDFDGDGKPDIVYNYAPTSGGVRFVFVKNLGGGNFSVGNPVEQSISFFRGAVRDFNNDGKADVLTSRNLYFGRADGTFDHIPITISAAPTSLLPAELNGDNNLDFVEISNANYAVHINNGAGGFTRTAHPKILDLQFRFTFEDFTADGKADYYAARTNSSLSPYANGVSIFGELSLVIKENMCQPRETKLANFNGDLKTDLVMWNPNTGNWSAKNVGWADETDPNTRTFNWGSGAHGDVPAPGDFDGDGKTDHAVYRNSTGVWYIFRSSDSSWYVFPFGLTDDIAVPNDYDGGGKTDIAVFRPSDGNWYIWFSETQSFQAQHFGTNGDKPVPADYDGDGKTDVAVYRPSEGNWYYYKSSDGNWVVMHWGIATDKPVPADYDGDNRADIAAYRDGLWWIWRSSTNSYSVFQIGQPGDFAMPIYRNSFTADLVVYRPSTNTWHTYDNRNVSGIVFGTSGDVPVQFGLPNN